MTEEPARSTTPYQGNDAGQALWQACTEQLSQDLPAQQFNTWIKPLTAQVAEDFSKLTLYVPNRFTLDWIKAQYAGRIAALLEAIYGQNISLELALAQRTASARTYAQPANQAPSAASEPASPAVAADDGARGLVRLRDHHHRGRVHDPRGQPHQGAAAAVQR